MKDYEITYIALYVDQVIKFTYQAVRTFRVEADTPQTALIKLGQHLICFTDVRFLKIIEINGE